MADHQNAGGTAVATREKRSLSDQVTGLMTSEQARSYIEPYLPKGTDIKRVAADLLLALKKDESGKLKKCTPESLLLGVAKIMQWGAELGTTAYLIPFGDQATPVRDYKFLAELSALCGYPMEGNAVREGDEFAFEYGLHPMLRHVPRAAKGAPVTHAYVIVRPKNGEPIFKVMSAEEIDGIRQKYSKQWKSGPLEAWYSIKTVVRQASKLMPKDPRLARFFEAVEEEEAIEAGLEPRPARAQIVDEQRPVSEAEEFQDDRDLDDLRA
jgi:recombination protein RecT